MFPHYMEECVLTLICTGCGTQEISAVSLIIAASDYWEVDESEEYQSSVRVLIRGEQPQGGR